MDHKEADFPFQSALPILQLTAVSVLFVVLQKLLASVRARVGPRVSGALGRFQSWIPPQTDIGCGAPKIFLLPR